MSSCNYFLIYNNDSDRVQPELLEIQTRLEMARTLHKQLILHPSCMPSPSEHSKNLPKQPPLFKTHETAPPPSETRYPPSSTPSPCSFDWRRRWNRTLLSPKRRDDSRTPPAPCSRNPFWRLHARLCGRGPKEKQCRRSRVRRG